MSAAVTAARAIGAALPTAPDDSDAPNVVGTSLLKAAQAVDAPEGYACGGVCACSTCHVYVLSGAQLLSPAEDEEEDI